MSSRTGMPEVCPDGATLVTSDAAVHGLPNRILAPTFLADTGVGTGVRVFTAHPGGLPGRTLVPGRARRRLRS